jgi:hypothetical protein
MLLDLGQTLVTPERLAEFRYGALIAFPSGDSPVLCEFDPLYFQPELKTERLWYCSMGSAQPITDPFLALMRNVFWHKSPPTVPDALWAATWALDHAIEVNPGGVNGPVQMAVLERTDKAQLRARVLEDGELGEHRQNIQAAKDALRKLRESYQVGAESGAADIPKP